MKGVQFKKGGEYRYRESLVHKKKYIYVGKIIYVGIRTYPLNQL
jgi:hypothetical protein